MVSAHHIPSNGRLRRGYTLMEMLLALGVVLTLAAVAWPLLERMTSETRLKRIVEQVRVELTAARLLAIDSGMIYQFRFEPAGRLYVILPFESLPASGDAVQVQSSSQADLVRDGQLPEGLSFHAAAVDESAAPLDAGWLGGLSNGRQLAETVWSPPVLFYPDGSAVDADLAIDDEYEHSIRLLVRELTGNVTVAKTAAEAM